MVEEVEQFFSSINNSPENPGNSLVHQLSSLQKLLVVGQKH
jgi:hypothetical protein